MLYDSSANVQNGSFLDLDGASSSSGSRRASHRLTSSSETDYLVQSSIQGPFKTPRTAFLASGFEAQLAPGSEISDSTPRGSRQDSVAVASNFTSFSSGPPYSQKLPPDFLDGILARLAASTSVYGSQLDISESRSSPLYMDARLPSTAKMKDESASPWSTEPLSLPRKARSSYLEPGRDDNDPITAVQHRPFPIPIHDPEASIVLPSTRPSTASPQFGSPRSSPRLSRKVVLERMGEEDVAKIRQLEEKNSQVFSLQRTLSNRNPRSSSNPQKPKRMKTKTPWQSIPYGPASPGSTYAVTATTNSNLTSINATSSEVARRERIISPARARTGIGRNNDFEPSYLRESGVRTARDALEAAATERFLERNGYSQKQNDDDITPAPPSSSEQAPAFLPSLPSSPTPLLHQTKHGHRAIPGSPSSKGVSGDWPFHLAGLQLVPDLSCRQTERRGSLSQQVIDEIVRLGMPEKGVYLDLDEQDNNQRPDTGWRARGQIVGSLLTVFNLS